jgi:hypothetical protein
LSLARTACQANTRSTVCSVSFRAEPKYRAMTRSDLDPGALPVRSEGHDARKRSGIEDGPQGRERVRARR